MGRRWLPIIMTGMAALANQAVHRVFATCRPAHMRRARCRWTWCASAAKCSGCLSISRAAPTISGCHVVLIRASVFSDAEPGSLFVGSVGVANRYFIIECDIIVLYNGAKRLGGELDKLDELDKT